MVGQLAHTAIDVVYVSECHEIASNCWVARAHTHSLLDKLGLSAGDAQAQILLPFVCFVSVQTAVYYCCVHLMSCGLNAVQLSPHVYWVGAMDWNARDIHGIVLSLHWIVCDVIMMTTFFLAVLCCALH